MSERRAFILGGTSGLGAELAKLALGEGMNVKIAGRTACTCALAMDTDPAIATRLELSPCDFAKGEYGTAAEHRSGYDLLIWCMGSRGKKPFIDMTAEDVGRLVALNLAPLALLPELFRNQRDHNRPLQVIVIGSTTSWKVRSDEAVYGGVNAAKGQFTRNLGVELPRDLPGSRVLLINPAGMKTPFWDGSDTDTSNFLEPSEVARSIWTLASGQLRRFCEFRVLREPNGTLYTEYGPSLPE